MGPANHLVPCPGQLAEHKWKGDRQLTAADTTSATTNLTLDIQGMHCAGCVAGVESALTAVAGVHSAHVNLATGPARVDCQPRRVTPRQLIEAVKGAGFRATVVSRELDADPQWLKRAGVEARNWRRRLVVAAAGLVALLTAGWLAARCGRFIRTCFGLSVTTLF